MMKMNYKEFNFYLPHRLKAKLDLMINRLDKSDAWLMIDGDEGTGKTNMATYLAYYIHCNTGREFTIKNFFFDARKLLSFAQSTEKQIIVYDEAVLGALSTEWYDEAQRNLIKLAMTGRKLHHFVILCIPKFYKLNEYLRLERTLGLINMYMKKEQFGYYKYIKKRQKEWLNDLWKRKHRANYTKCMNFGGYVPEVFTKLFNEEDAKYYEAMKDEAISSIGKKPKKEVNEDKEEARALKKKIGRLKFPILNMTELARKMEIPERTIFNWIDRNENPSKTQQNISSKLSAAVDIYDKGVSENGITAQ